MPRRALVIQVFVASPSDVRDEREQLETIILEINKIWSRSSDIVFELIKWETDVYPAFGPDPQSVINSQIGDDYDIFIGILWSRFGTKTPRAESGTLEEFERAYSRLKSEPNKPEIMVYFKDAALPPSKIDPAEIDKIQHFQKKITSMGGIYATFEDSDSFRSSLRAHLSAIAQKILAKSANESVRMAEQLVVAPHETDDEELGYLDFTERYETVIPELITVLQEINEATEKIGRQLRERSGDIERLQQRQADKKEIRKIIRISSENLETYSKILQHKVPLLSTLASTGFDALSNELALQGDVTGSDPEDLTILEKGLSDLLATIAGTRTPVTMFRDAASQIPRIPSEMNRAKRFTVSQLDAFLMELAKIQHVVSNVLVSVREMIVK